MPFPANTQEADTWPQFRALSESDKHLSDKYRDPLDAKRL